MATPLVGADVESICGKCGDVWHVVVAKVGDKIVKVQCKQCGAQHRHSPPAAVREKERLAREALRAAGRASSPSLTTPRAARGSRAPRTPPGPSVQPDPSRPPRPYRPTDTFAVADTVQHPSFGVGVVEVVPEPGKMQVYFTDGRRVLVMGRGQGTPLLTRRRPVPGEDA